MNLLFVHGHESMKEDILGNYYTSGSYNLNVWKQYSSVFKNLNVMFRKESKIYDVDFAEKHFQKFDQDKINFIEIPNNQSSFIDYLNIKKRININTILENQVIESDYVIARLPSEISCKAINYAIKHRKPYLIELVGCPWDAYWNHSLKGKLFAPYSWYTTKKHIRNSDFVLYVTKKFLQRRYPTKGLSLGCSDVNLKGIDPKILEKRIKKIEFKFSAGNKQLILGTIAPLDVRYKGQRFVIEALSKLKKDGYDIEYRLVGGGDKSTLAQHAKNHDVEENVRFINGMSHDEIFEFLDEIDLYVHPSETEGLPRALVEALSRGCPAIGSNVGGIPELIHSKSLFNSGSVDEIVDLIRGLNCNVMVENAIKNFSTSKDYEQNKLIMKRNKFYKSLVKSGNV